MSLKFHIISIIAFVASFLMPSNAFAQDDNDLDSIAMNRYEGFNSGSGTGIYDKLTNDTVVPAMFDYIEFDRAERGNNGEVCYFYYEKGIKKGSVEINMADNSTNISEEDNPVMVGNLDKCTTIDSALAKSFHDILLKYMSKNDASYGQITVLNAKDCTLSTWSAIEKSKNGYIDGRLLKRKCSVRAIFPAIITPFFPYMKFSLADSVDVGNGTLKINNDIVFRDSSVVGKCTWQEALEKCSYIAFYKFFEKMDSAHALRMWDKAFAPARDGNTLDMAALLYTTCFSDRFCEPTLEGDSIRKLDSDILPEGANEATRKFLMNTTLAKETEKQTGRMIPGLCVQTPILNKDHTESENRELEFIGFYPATNTQYVIVYFMEMPKDNAESQYRDYALIEELATWIDNNR